MCPLMTVIGTLWFLGCVALLAADLDLRTLPNEGRENEILKSLHHAYRTFVDRLWELESRSPGIWLLLVLLYPWLLFQYRPEVPQSPTKPIGEPLRPVPTQAPTPAPTDRNSLALYRSPLGPLPAPFVPAECPAEATAQVFADEGLVDLSRSEEWVAEIRSRGFDVEYIDNGLTLVGWKIQVRGEPDEKPSYAYA